MFIYNSLTNLVSFETHLYKLSFATTEVTWTDQNKYKCSPVQIIFNSYRVARSHLLKVVNPYDFARYTFENL